MDASRRELTHGRHNGFHEGDVSDHQPGNRYDRHVVSLHVRMTNREHARYRENRMNDWECTQQDSSPRLQSRVHPHARRVENVNAHRADNLGGPHVE
ncbi:MAG: hypothetical protein NPIRA05_17720 [Nitrospirales bacterium]|nr:MAG: hypothetical protein NPIRA05_17720 [Nitrospirales bacterium]